MLERKELNTEKKEKEKYYQRNRYASEEVERLRFKSKRKMDECRADNQERRERIKESR
jgi:hypothetical protein